jgi:hypothetical protein
MQTHVGLQRERIDVRYDAGAHTITFVRECS